MYLPPCSCFEWPLLLVLFFSINLSNFDTCHCNIFKCLTSLTVSMYSSHSLNIPGCTMVFKLLYTGTYHDQGTEWCCLYSLSFHSIIFFSLVYGTISFVGSNIVPKFKTDCNHSLARHPSENLLWIL